jgi:hypothetical protein
MSEREIECLRKRKKEREREREYRIMEACLAGHELHVDISVRVDTRIRHDSWLSPRERMAIWAVLLDALGQSAGS